MGVQIEMWVGQKIRVGGEKYGGQKCMAGQRKICIDERNIGGWVVRNMGGLKNM